MTTKGSKKKQKDDFLSPKDYKSYIIIAIVFMIFFFIGDNFFEKDILKLPFGLLGSIIGLLIAKLFYK